MEPADCPGESDDSDNIKCTRRCLREFTKQNDDLSGWIGYSKQSGIWPQVICALSETASVLDCRGFETRDGGGSWRPTLRLTWVPNPSIRCKGDRASTLREAD